MTRMTLMRHYILAAEALEEASPNVPEIKRHVDVLNKMKAPALRPLWIVHGWPI